MSIEVLGAFSRISNADAFCCFESIFIGCEIVILCLSIFCCSLHFSSFVMKMYIINDCIFLFIVTVINSAVTTGPFFNPLPPSSLNNKYCMPTFWF